MGILDFMRFLTGVVSILVFLLLAPGASAQEGSLAGLAKKTKEEREEKKGESKVLRSDDLRRAKGRVYVPPAGAGAAPSAAADADDQESGGDEAAGEESGEGDEPTPAEERAALTEQLQSELALQQDRVSKLQEQIADAQTQLADQSTYYPGNPRRAALEELIEKCNAEIADAQKTIADIRRRARGQGIALR